MTSVRHLVVAFIFTLSMLSSSDYCVGASTLSSSSQSQPQRLSAEGTFVRGMMAADHQFGFYMTESETSQGGERRRSGEEDEIDAWEGCADELVVSGTMTPMQHAVYKARDAAGNFAGVVRKRAFSQTTVK
mmetsp:Transcript_4804/g.8011  ORF Transcript_4804/g.8011 Transcript_4804/m.8011 type:complete len:131 (-) Transcript_4804:226-618(-)|eukprot:CAMPEP_0196132998 /NCGR_PEP_ID=MMETSP0910-20130528/2401_1 /TAXON_ID=49265 /ORGANISM="Thalassiosira rotula, Strain GSO102" /LENGTH=130 /DNA_ID=CAMNT_0041392671 /DNA_START=134 /DNA_END=526 /DNA_ORIENTATION=-